MNKLKKIRAFLGDHIKKPYYYVPPCPDCGSSVTGRFIIGAENNTNEWILHESLRNGEMATIIPVALSGNCFCVDCDVIFKAKIEQKMLSLSEIERQKRLRRTNEMYVSLKRIEKEKQRHRNFISRSIGKL